jgi:L-alanine-DL-glutamate epimerase-like enolase superfamily enzyme
VITDLDIRIVKHPLTFRQPARTSRDVLSEKPTWFVVAKNRAGKMGIGECSLIPGLSPEHPVRAARALAELAAGNALDPNKMTAQYPAVKFAAEMALLDLLGGGRRTLFEGDFSEGKAAMPINGLVWMDEFLETGRRIAPASDFTLRLDANGAFDTETHGQVIEKLHRLARFEVHSLEQPIKPGKWDRMAAITQDSPVPIALDEELIGISDSKVREGMLAWIKPAFIVLKPSLLGGFSESGDWVDSARAAGIGWWATSALESNIGLNAIAQWTDDALLDVASADRLPQGLGTGGLFTNNISSPLAVENGELRIDLERSWDLDSLAS